MRYAFPIRGTTMLRVTASLAATCVVALALAGCGRNGPLTPWPTFDLGQPGATPPSLADLGPADLAPPPDMVPPPLRTWEWVAPSVTGNPLNAIGGTAPNDLWLAGTLGTVLHWDGTRATVAYQGGPNDNFTSVAALPSGDVFIGGQTSDGSLLHWDGKSWSTTSSISDKPIHAIVAGRQYAFAAVEVDGAGAVWLYIPGYGWTDVYLYSAVGPPILRDLALFDDGAMGPYVPLFAVGDAGAILWRDTSEWTRGASMPAGGAADPFSSDKSYYGVWGATKTDVWAAFTSGTTAGFSHWDGTAWTVAQTLPLTCNNNAKIMPADHGKRLVGLDANHIIAEPSPTGYCPPIAWNGTTWAPLSSDKTQPAAPSFAAAGGRWYAVTSAGELQVSNNDDSWTSLPQASVRQPMYRVSVSDDGVWATGQSSGVQPLMWHSDGWQASAPPLNGAYFTANDTWAINANDVWMAGNLDGKGVVSRWDGTSWAPPTTLPNSDRITSIWADRDDDVWAVGGGTPYDPWGGAESCHVFHFDGTSWIDVPVPPHPTDIVSPSVFGLRSDAVWISLHIWNTTHRWVWKWDGTSITQVAYWPEGDVQSIGRPWASSDDDVWIPAQPVIHWDGTAWSAVDSPGDLFINAIYGTSRDDVWAVGQGPFGGAIWHWDGAKLVDAFDTGPALYDIRGSAHMLPWVVGANGATLRLVEHARIP